ncbi:RlmE/FtsJ family methyltransferase [Flexivirga aerilata]|uniref:RlmE/FtsJ family methyltransferase n=1 Tax=Flexivirga aerilata TaxID=1656889 RepID=UPI001BB2C8D4|nr:FtsJ-like methyltransferase family protein [Flexivirga aerilata]
MAPVEPPVLFSVAPDYYRFAVAELRHALDVTKVQRVGPDAGVVSLGAGGIAEVADACLGGELPLIRHLAQADGVRGAGGFERPDELAEWAASVLMASLQTGDTISLHTWDSGEAEFRPGKVRRPLLELLLDNGIRVVTSGASRVGSVCIGAERVVAGVNPTDVSLVDWAGGRIRFATRPEQVSRAEFKLEELFGFVGEPVGSTAVDLGASPGGWTRILADRGFATIHAVDPAELDQRVLDLPGVQHHQQTAGDFVKDWDGEPVDLIVNDMRMVPQLTAHTMVEAARLLRPGGQAVITLKLGTNNPVKQIDDALGMLAASYDPSFMRQLQHNRHEVTLVATRR